MGAFSLIVVINLLNRLAELFKQCLIAPLARRDNDPNIWKSLSLCCIKSTALEVDDKNQAQQMYRDLYSALPSDQRNNYAYFWLWWVKAAYDADKEADAKKICQKGGSIESDIKVIFQQIGKA